ncbi:MAG TPA: aldehyde dehydrogenase family protein [Conexivisphaerales archaeon]|nr:aldehyde dehydrogenase family protein [Conexivisphaerales archaeon]
MQRSSRRLELNGFFDGVFGTYDDSKVFRLFIGGEWRESGDGKLFNLVSPVDGGVFASAAAATQQDVSDAVASAFSRQHLIRDIAGIERAGIMEEARHILLEHEDDFVGALMLEGGKTRGDAQGEVRGIGNRMALALDEARRIYGEYIPGDWSKDTLAKIALVIREPVGVVAAISPFNYPLFIPATKIIPALLAGNSVVVKPASATPVAALLFARVLEAAGIPKGVLNVVTGSGGVVGDSLVSDPRVSMVSLTGSTEAGRRIVEKAGIKKLHLELGGKAYAIVLSDADLKLAAAKTVEGSLKSAGQRCDAVSAVIVEEAVADEYVERALEAFDSFKFGNPFDDGVQVGPLINREAAVRVNLLVSDAVHKGARLLRGGDFKEAYHQPTFLDSVNLDCRIAWEETFGPVVTVIRVKGEEEALEITARSRYGLDGCVFSKDFYRMWRVAKRVQAGEIVVNDLPRHGTGYFPFGGAKESGTGREGVGYSIDEMTNLKTIVFNLEPGRMGKKTLV